MPSSRGSSQPRYRTCVSYISCIGRQVLYHQHHLEASISLGGQHTVEFLDTSALDKPGDSKSRGCSGFQGSQGTRGTHVTRQNPHRNWPRLPWLLQKGRASSICSTVNCIAEGPRARVTAPWLGQKGREQKGLLKQLSAWHYQKEI